MTPDERMNFKVLVEGSTSFDLVEMLALITGEMDKRTAKAAKFLEKEMRAKTAAARVEVTTHEDMARGVRVFLDAPLTIFDVIDSIDADNITRGDQ